MKIGMNVARIGTDVARIGMNIARIVMQLPVVYSLATMMVFEFPPRLSLSSHVKTESL